MFAVFAIAPGEVRYRAAECAGSQGKVEEDIHPERKADQSADPCAGCGLGEQAAKRDASKEAKRRAGTEDQSAQSADNSGDYVNACVREQAARSVDDERNAHGAENARGGTGRDAGGGNTENDLREAEGSRHSFNRASPKSDG